LVVGSYYRHKLTARPARILKVSNEAPRPDGTPQPQPKWLRHIRFSVEGPKHRLKAENASSRPAGRSFFPSPPMSQFDNPVSHKRNTFLRNGNRHPRNHKVVSRNRKPIPANSNPIPHNDNSIPANDNRIPDNGNQIPYYAGLFMRNWFRRSRGKPLILRGNIEFQRRFLIFPVPRLVRTGLPPPPSSLACGPAFSYVSLSWRKFKGLPTLWSLSAGRHSPI